MPNAPTRILAGHFVQTNPTLGLTERAATRIIDLLLEKPGLTDESRRSPDSVMSFEPRAFAPAAAAVTPPNDLVLRRVTRLKPSPGPRSAPAPRSQPFLPIYAPRSASSASATGREPHGPKTRDFPSRTLVPLTLDDGRRLAASRRAPFAGLGVQGSSMPPPSWTSHTLQTTTHRLLAAHTSPR